MFGNRQLVEVPQLQLGEPLDVSGFWNLEYQMPVQEAPELCNSSVLFFKHVGIVSFEVFLTSMKLCQTVVVTSGRIGFLP